MNETTRSHPSPTTTQVVNQPASKNWYTHAAEQQKPFVEKATNYSAVSLEYLESSPIQVRGPATGRQYMFSGNQSVQPVDLRDADALLRTRFFRKI